MGYKARNVAWAAKGSWYRRANSERYARIADIDYLAVNNQQFPLTEKDLRKKFAKPGFKQGLERLFPLKGKRYFKAVGGKDNATGCTYHELSTGSPASSVTSAMSVRSNRD